MTNEELIQNFYRAFQNKDVAEMKACYHPEISFSDEAFPNLKGKQVGAMWDMLIQGGKDMRLIFKDIRTNETSGSVTWEAFYTLSLTGRKVHNIISASFEFKEGKIIKHRDKFNFWRWSRQVFGITGWLLGWTPILKNKVQKTVAERLQKFIANNSQYQ